MCVPTIENDKYESVVIFRLLNLLLSSTIRDISRALQHFRCSFTGKFTFTKFTCSALSVLHHALAAIIPCHKFFDYPCLGPSPLLHSFKIAVLKVLIRKGVMKPTLKCLFSITLLHFILCCLRLVDRLQMTSSFHRRCHHVIEKHAWSKNGNTKLKVRWHTVYDY
jgi:hypothetical protein